MTEQKYSECRRCGAHNPTTCGGDAAPLSTAPCLLFDRRFVNENVPPVDEPIDVWDPAHWVL